MDDRDEGRKDSRHDGEGEMIARKEEKLEGKVT